MFAKQCRHVRVYLSHGRGSSQRRRLATVSYTHLDVYKRQSEKHKPSVMTSSEVENKTMPSSSPTKSAYAPKAVSYTHLTV